jgi:hypothetical protein
MAKDNRTFEESYEDGYRSIRPGAPIAVPPHTIPSSKKTDYEWGYERGVAAAHGTKHPNSN